MLCDVCIYLYKSLFFILVFFLYRMVNKTLIQHVLSERWNYSYCTLIKVNQILNRCASIIRLDDRCSPQMSKAYSLMRALAYTLNYEAPSKSLRIIGYVIGVLILLFGIFFIYANSMIKAFSGWISLSAATLLVAVGIAIVYVVRRTEHDKYSENFSAKR